MEYDDLIDKENARLISKYLSAYLGYSHTISTYEILISYLLHKEEIQIAILFFDFPEPISICKTRYSEYAYQKVAVADWVQFNLAKKVPYKLKEREPWIIKKLMTM